MTIYVRTQDTAGSVGHVYTQIIRFVRAAGWRGELEQEQALLRIAITVISLSYLLSGWPASKYGADVWLVGIQIGFAFLAYSALFLAVTLKWSDPSVPRRVVGVIGDVSMASLALYLTGPMGAIWCGLFLWITLGNGFRYGENFLYLSGAASLVGFSTVVFIVPYWGEHIELAIGLGVTLLVIPSYTAALIRRLNQARAQAETADRSKDDFLSLISDEIRTPLNGIVGLTDLMRTSPLDPEHREYVETIYGSGETLVRKIDGMFNQSNIETGQFSLDNLQFDLYALINSTLRMLETEASAKATQLQKTISPKTPFLLYGDPHKLRQIIINLVGNAVKFTDCGFVSLRVYPCEQEGDRVTLRFEVADTGSGIPADRLHSVFEPFTPSDSSASRSYYGAGLGPSDCRHLVELMGGEISIQSTCGLGTTYWFTIPFETGMVHAVHPAQSWTASCNVVYLRHEAVVHTDIPILLRNWQIPFRTVKTVKEAEELFTSASCIRQEPADALIIDGFLYSNELESLLSLLDSEHPVAATAVVFVNTESCPYALTRPEHEHLFVLNRPLDKRILFNTLHACYSKHGRNDDVIHIARQQIKESSLSKPVTVLIGDDGAANRLVLQRILQRMGCRCFAVNSGEAVLDALEYGQYDIAIIDQNMPDIGGIDVFRAYSMAHGGQTSTKFVILTTDATAEASDSCVVAGIEYFLTKPVSVHRLRGILDCVISAGEETEKGYQAFAQRGQDFSVLPVVSEHGLENLRLLADADSIFMRDIIVNFEIDTNQDIRNLEFAAGSGNWLAFRNSARAFKGSAASLGLVQLVQLATEAQAMGQEDFERNASSHIRTIKLATDAALEVLREKWKSICRLG